MMVLSVPHGVCGSLRQTPSPFLLPNLSIFLPACEKMSAAPGKSGPPRVASLQCLGPDSSTSRAPPLHQHSCCGVVAGLLLTFLLAKSNFQMQEWNINRKSWTQQWQSKPRPCSWKEEWYLTVYVPLPWPLLTNINSRWMIKSPVFLPLFFFIVPSRHLVLCFQ